MKSNTYRNQHFIALAFILVTTAPFIRADEPSPKPVAGDASPAQVSPDIPKIHDSVTHFVLFSGPKDIIKDWLINTTLMSPVTIADPPLTIEPDVRQFAPNIPAGIPVGVDTSPIRVSIGGSFPAENGGLIYQMILKSYKPISKAELESLFVKYLKAVDQKLMLPAQVIEKDLRAKIDFLSQQIQSEKDLMVQRRNEFSKNFLSYGTTITIDALSDLEMQFQRDIAKNSLNIAILDAQIMTQKKSISGGKHMPANDLTIEEEVDVLNTLRDLQAARKALAQKLGDNHPDVKAVDEKIEIYKSRFTRELDIVPHTSLANQLNEILKSRDSALVEKAHLEQQRQFLASLKLNIANTEKLKSSLDIDNKHSQERIEQIQKQILELDDVAYRIIHNRLAQNQMAMITILDPASKPETKAEEKTASSDAKESKPAPDSKEEKKSTSPAPAESPK